MAAEVVTGAMHVLHVSPYYAPAWAYGDVPRLVERLARAQADRGHTVTVLTTDAMAPHERLPAGDTIVDGVRVIRVRNVSGSTRTWFGCSTPLGMRQRARAVVADAWPAVVHLHELITVENLRAVPAIPGAVRVVASLHGQLSNNRGVSTRLARVWRALGGRAVINRVETFVVSSGTERAEFASAWPALFGEGPPATAVVPDGVEPPAEPSDAERRAARAALGAGVGPLMVVVAPLRRDGSTASLIDALPPMKVGTPHMRLAFAGADEGGGTELRHHAAAFGVESQIHFAGYIAPSRVPSIVSAADLVVLPDRCPDVALFARTAFAYGVPVIAASDVLNASLHEGALILGAGRPGAHQWADAISGVLADVSRRSELVAAGRRIMSALAWPAVAARWDHVYGGGGSAGGF